MQPFQQQRKTTISSPSNLRSGFIPAQQKREHKSYNGQLLRNGDIVYQVKDDLQKPSLITYNITECLQDGRIKITTTKENSSVTQSVSPITVHTNPQALLEHWLATAKHAYEVDLPIKIQTLESLLRDINPNWNNIEVGEGLDNQEI